MALHCRHIYLSNKLLLRIAAVYISSLIFAYAAAPGQGRGECGVFYI